MKENHLLNYLLQLGDNALVLGQRLAEWCGHGPILEQDMAITNISLDLFGQTRNLFQYAAEVEGEGRSEDDLAFERIVNVPKRGIGATTIQKLQMAARSMGISLETATRELTKTDEIRGKARTALRAFILDLDRWRSEAKDIRHTEIAERILDESGYTQMWRDNKDAKSAGRLENLKELILAMGEFETLEGYLEHLRRG